MLTGISPLISPDLLKVLCEMGHGDKIVFADAHFPGHSVNGRTLRADGLLIPDLLDAVLPLFALDTYVEYPAQMMAPVKGDSADPLVEAAYEKVFAAHLKPDQEISIGKLERFAFYEASSRAFAVVVTGDTAKYGNLILCKGVTPLR